MSVPSVPVVIITALLTASTTCSIPRKNTGLPVPLEEARQPADTEFYNFFPPGPDSHSAITYVACSLTSFRNKHHPPRAFHLKLEPLLYAD